MLDSVEFGAQHCLFEAARRVKEVTASKRLVNCVPNWCLVRTGKLGHGNGGFGESRKNVKIDAVKIVILLSWDLRW
jgi:hypothetical protein